MAKKMTKSESRARFKQKIKKAKEIKKAHPGKKWQMCIKEAFKK